MIWLLFGALAFVAFVVQWIAQDAALASMGWGIALIVGGTTIAFGGRRSFDVFSPLFFAGLISALTYGVAAIIPFVVELGPFSARIATLLDFYPTAAMVSYFCVIGFYAGYSIHISDVPGRWLGTILKDVEQSGSALFQFWGLHLVLGLGVVAILISQNVYLQTTLEFQSPLFHSAVGFLRPCLLLALGVVVAIAYQSGRRSEKYVAGIVFVVLFFLGLLSGSKEWLLLPVAVVLLARNYSVHFLKRRTIVALIVFGIFLFPVVMAFNVVHRGVLLSEGGYQEHSLTKSIGIAIDEFGQQDPDDAVALAADYSSSRFSNIAVVANLFRYFSDDGDPKYGETYSRVVLGLIPRFIWSEKPPLVISKRFAVDLGYSNAEEEVLGESVSKTAVAPTLVGELVYNFSWFAPIGALLLGLFYRFVYDSFLLARDIAPIASIGLYATWWHALVFNIDAGFAGITMGWLKFTLFVIVMIGVWNGLRSKKNRQWQGAVT